MTDRPQLDLLATADVVDLLLDAQARVVPAVRAQRDALSAAADLLAARLTAGGRVLFTGAGTSGRLAAAEAAELPGTFGLDPLLAPARVAAANDGDEDDLGLAEGDIRAFAITAADTVVAVAASGRTPYTLAVARAARSAGAAVIAIVNADGSELAELAAIAVVAVVGDEVLRGSTRMSAGTAQKVALNVLSTAAMVRFGRVHGDLMVDVVAANAKLRARAAGIVAEIAGCTSGEAVDALDACGGNARAAVLMQALGLSAPQARARAASHQSLRDALR